MASHIICETLKYENITLLVVPSLLALRRWGRFVGETSALQRQKCYTDDVNHCLNLMVFLIFRVDVFTGLLS